jgi:hypothetical protein
MKRSFFIFGMICLMTANSMAQQMIIPASKNQLWGAIDQSGNWLFKPKNLVLKDFYDGVALVKLNNGWQYVNTKGEIISVNKPYQCQHDFSEGMARVHENRTWGYIDVSGNYAIEPRYEAAKDFSEGLAAVQIDTKWGYIDHGGNLIIKPSFDGAWDFSCGMAIVLINERKEYINKNGELIPNPDGHEVHRGFRDNYAPVRKNDLWGYIDTHGNYIVKPVYEKADRFMSGLAPVRKSGKCGYINTAGEETIPLSYTVSKLCTENMALVGMDDKWFYINTETGQIVGQNKPYRVRFYFSEGLARVLLKDKTGFINKNGEIVIECIYDDAKDFNKGMAAVKISGLWGFIDKTGKMVIQPEYDGIRFPEIWDGE